MRAAPTSVLLILLAVSADVHAQAPDEPLRQEAQAAYDRGVELFDEERYDLALIQFRHAQELVPNDRVLYSIGNVHAALGQSVEAIEAYEAYLARAGRGLPRRRRATIEGALARQRERVGHLTVRSNVDGATLTIDGVDRATLPLSTPVALSIGAYEVGVRAAGYDTPTRRVEIAGRAQLDVEMTLRPVVRARAILRVSSRLAAVEVSIDDRSVGATPLEETVVVEPGHHVVRGRRPGYTSARVDIDLDEGVEREVNLVLEPAPAPEAGTVERVALHLPDAPTSLWVDGQPVVGSATDLTLPIGPHDLRIEVEGRRPHREAITVRREAPLELTPALTWTTQARSARVAAADRRRFRGWLVTGGGAAISAAALGVLFWNVTRAAELDRYAEGLWCLDHTAGDCSELISVREEGSARHLQTTVPRYRAGGLVALGAGLVLASVGLQVALSTPSDQEIDAQASAALSLGFGPGGASLTADF